MIQKIVKTIIAIVVCMLVAFLPFLSKDMISPYSPYFEGNSFSTYIVCCVAYSFLVTIILYFIIDRALPKPIRHAGVLLFFIGVFIAAIIGLVLPPDLSINMLKHPEREHFRYLMLAFSLLFFSVACILIMKEKWNDFPKWNKWIILFFIGALIEMSWEFYHHYHYPENLQVWINQGKKAEDFVNHYDNFTMIRFGAIGRICQYTVVAWLGYILLQCRFIKLWSLIPIVLLSIMGIIAAVLVFTYGFSLPKNVQIFFLFFIPGIPFLLLYWMGVALISKPIVPSKS